MKKLLFISLLISVPALGMEVETETKSQKHMVRCVYFEGPFSPWGVTRKELEEQFQRQRETLGKFEKELLQSNSDYTYGAESDGWRIHTAHFKDWSYFEVRFDSLFPEFEYEAAKKCLKQYNSTITQFLTPDEFNELKQNSTFYD